MIEDEGENVKPIGKWRLGLAALVVTVVAGGAQAFEVTDTQGRRHRLIPAACPLTPAR